jgi:acyl-CoA reductase-like NAD-dependent aldehyde dehydrogenase
VQRILVQERIYDRFRDALLDYTRKNVRCGDPRNRSVIVGPMIDAAAIERVRRTIDDAVRGGAKILLGNEVVGPCLTPTIVENADLKSQICQSEIFAPVATLHRYSDFDQALTIANDTPYGLQAGVFTRDIRRAWQAFESLEVGGVMINQAPTWRVETMPYGGVKQSGFGREGIRYAMEEMTEPRVMVMRME